MTTQTQTLTDFLLARIAEDENSAKNARRWGTANRNTERELAECEARAAMVGSYLGTVAARDRTLAEVQDGVLTGVEAIINPQLAEAMVMAQRDMIRLLALPYADHPDFREEWRA